MTDCRGPPLRTCTHLTAPMRQNFSAISTEEEMKTVIALTLFAATALFASPVTVHLVDTGNGVSDGTFFVGPYDITINGSSYKAMCYDIADDETVGDTWTANKLSITDVTGGGGQFSPMSNSSFKYQEVAYLASFSPSTAAAQIDLQHAVWSLFAPAAVTITAGVQSWLTNATAHAASYDSSHVSFLEAPNHQAVIVTSPEPSAASLLLIGAGLWLVSRFILRRVR